MVYYIASLYLIATVTGCFSDYYFTEAVRNTVGVFGVFLYIIKAVNLA